MIPIANVPLDSGNGPAPLRPATRDPGEASGSFSSAMDQAAASPAASPAPASIAPASNGPDPAPAGTRASRATPGQPAAATDPTQPAGTAAAPAQGAGSGSAAKLLASLAAGKGASRRPTAAAPTDQTSTPPDTAEGMKAQASLHTQPALERERGTPPRQDSGTVSTAGTDRSGAPDAGAGGSSAGSNASAEAVAAQALTQALQNSTAQTSASLGAAALAQSTRASVASVAAAGMAQERAGFVHGSTGHATAAEQGGGGPLDTGAPDGQAAPGSAAFDAQLASAQGGALGLSSRAAGTTLAFPAGTADGSSAAPGAAHAVTTVAQPDPAQSLASTLQSLNASAASAGGASHASVQVATPFGQSGFGQDVAQQILVLARNGKQSAELSLHPADMGPVNVSIQMSGMQASLLISAGHEATRAALQQALPQLHQLFQNSGLQLTGAHVGDGAPRHPDQPPSRGYTGSGRGTPGAVPAAGHSAPAAGSASSLRLVDTFA